MAQWTPGELEAKREGPNWTNVFPVNLLHAWHQGRQPSYRTASQGTAGGDNALAESLQGRQVETRRRRPGEEAHLERLSSARPRPSFHLLLPRMENTTSRKLAPTPGAPNMSHRKMGRGSAKSLWRNEWSREVSLPRPSPTPTLNRRVHLDSGEALLGDARPAGRDYETRGGAPGPGGGNREPGAGSRAPGGGGAAGAAGWGRGPGREGGRGPGSKAGGGPGRCRAAGGMEGALTWR